MNPRLVLLSLLPLVLAQPPSYIFPGDAPYGVPTANLSSILTCPYAPLTASSKAVLLVHGTGSTGEESWGSTYAPALNASGYAPCYVTLPGRSAGDLQVTSAYVAYAMHQVSAMAGGTQIAAIGHSQGNPNIQWALRFYPSTRAVVRSYVGLAPDLGPGCELFRTICTAVGSVPWCNDAVWQQSLGSMYYEGLNYKEHYALVNSTTVWTETDEVVFPAEANASLPGAVVLSVQDLCPLQTPDHFLMLTDSAAFAIALDALAHGTASLARISTSVCGEPVGMGMNITAPEFVRIVFNDLVLGNVLTPKVYHEPPLLPYAQLANQ